MDVIEQGWRGRRRWGTLIMILAALAFGIAIGSRTGGSAPAKPVPAVTVTRTYFDLGPPPAAYFQLPDSVTPIPAASSKR